MRLYYLTKDEHALDNIKKRHLKISFSDDVNDLYELQPFDFVRRDIRKKWRKNITKHAKTQGFISFTTDWSTPTMWAHYADNNKGVCYGFDINCEHLVQIIYEDNLRKFDHRAIKDQLILTSETDYASKTKSSHWKYEKEWRIYSSLTRKEIELKKNGQKVFFIEFSDSFKLREVIIGVNSDQTSKSIRAALLPSDNVKIRTARTSFREYKIVEQENERMQK